MKPIGLPNLIPKALRVHDNEVVEVANRANKIVVNLSKNKKSKNLMHIPNIKAIGKPNFLILDAKKTFNYWRLPVIKALIFWYFDLKNYIQIETDASGYATSGVLSQLNLKSDEPPNDSNKSDFSQWHPIVYFFRKIIFAKTQNKTYNMELLAIIKAFKTWPLSRELQIESSYSNLL